jgi:Protein of unknown function (DUF1573)
MKKIIVFAFSLMGFAAVYAQQVPQSDPAKANNAQVTPAIAAAPQAYKADDNLLLRETGYDFGKIPQGKPVTYVFGIKNTGKDSLKLDEVKASCGCTTPVWDKSAIAPGASSQITVGYNAYSEGPFEKFITITYNGGQTKTLKISGNVWKAPASSAPENASLLQLKNNQ